MSKGPRTGWYSWRGDPGPSPGRQTNSCILSRLLYATSWNYSLARIRKDFLFTLLLVHLILHISPHHSHHLRSHHPSLPRPFTADLKLISFTNPFLYSHSYSFRTAFTDLNLYCIKGALALFVLVFLILATCAR